MTSRPLPTLREFLGADERVEGYETWVAGNLALSQAAETPDIAALIRLVNILSVATVEGARIERERHGRTDSQTVASLGRATGIAVMAPILCLAKGPGALPPLVDAGMARQAIITAKE